MKRKKKHLCDTSLFKINFVIFIDKKMKKKRKNERHIKIDEQKCAQRSRK